MHRIHRELFTLALTAAGATAILASPGRAQSAKTTGQDQAIVNTFEIDWIETSDLMSPAV